MSDTKVIDRVVEEESVSEAPPVRLENWKECFGDYRSPNLEGNVYGHPRFRDGEYVWTSRLVWLDKTLKLAQTRSRHYILGKEAS